MGYSTSPYTINANQALLTPILTSDQKEIVQYFSEVEAPKKAAKIRECFAIARKLRSTYPRLAHLADTMEIFVRGPAVVARRKDTAPALIDTPSPAAVLLPFANSSTQIIQAWLDKALSAKTIIVQNAQLTEEGKEEVRRWVLGNPGWEADWDGPRLTIHIMEPLL